VEPTYTRDGLLIDDPDVFPGTGERDSPPAEREFGEMAVPRDPREHKWDEENDGVNRVLWDAAGSDNVPLMQQAIEDGAAVNAANPGEPENTPASARRAPRPDARPARSEVELNASVGNPSSCRRHVPLDSAAPRCVQRGEAGGHCAA